MTSKLLALLLSLPLFCASWVSAADEPSPAAAPAPSAVIGDAAAKTPEEKIEEKLEELKDTPDFAELCRNIAEGIEQAVDEVTTEDFEKLAKEIRRKVLRAIREGLGNPATDPTAKRWAAAYDELVQSFEDPTKPFTERRGAYLGAAALLKRVAEPHDPRPASGIPADALDEEAIVEEIARELRENKEIDLFKLETDFAESAEMLIATLRDLMNATDETKILLKEYQDKTREEVTGTIRSFERAQLVRERWIRAYNIFVDRVEKSKKLTVTTSQEWEKALSILVAGLKTAIGKEADWTKELAAAQGSRPRGTSMNAGGGAPGSYQSPYGNTFHGWMTARRIQIIRNRAAIYRARTARIAGN